jgi:hypothetical protein
VPLRGFFFLSPPLAVSLKRKDLRLYLDAEIHEALNVLADVERMELQELAEQIIRAEVVRRVHAAMVIAGKAGRLGISREEAE